MKLKTALLLLLMVPLPLLAQQSPKEEHFIEVTGTAQIDVEPNEIYLIVQLKEFEEGRQKTTLETIDKAFLNAIQESGIDRKNLQLSDAGLKLGGRRRNKDVFREKSYELKLSSAAQVEKFLDKIENVKVEYVDIVRLHHSDLEKIKLDLKVKALQAAKAKAEALVKSIDSELGKPITIRDTDFIPNVNVGNVLYEYKRKIAYDATVNYQTAVEEPAGVEFKKIKLQAQVTAQFEIK